MTEQTQPTDALAKLRHLYTNMINGGVRDTASAKRIAEGLLSPAIEALEKWGTPAGAGEVVAWMWQHDETGQTGFVDCWQVENGWQEQNPRLRLVSKLFTTPQPTQAQAGAVPLTEQQMDAIWEECKFDNGDEWSIDWTSAVRAAERLHGIKGADHA